MKIVQTVVSSQGFRDQAANPTRVALLGELARLCARKCGRLLLIPAGFLTADSEKGVPALVEEVRRIAERVYDKFSSCWLRREHPLTQRMLTLTEEVWEANFKPIMGNAKMRAVIRLANLLSRRPRRPPTLQMAQWQTSHVPR